LQGSGVINPANSITGITHKVSTAPPVSDVRGVHRHFHGTHGNNEVTMAIMTEAPAIQNIQYDDLNFIRRDDKSLWLNAQQIIFNID
jgi:hypothetical protein